MSCGCSVVAQYVLETSTVLAAFESLRLAYSADAAYLYSTRDPPEIPQASQQPSMLLSNSRSPLASPSHLAKKSGDTIHAPTFDDAPLNETDTLVDLSHDSSNGETEDEEDYEDQQLMDIPENLRLPVVYPQRRYVGACNVQTVKDSEFPSLRLRSAQPVVSKLCWAAR